MARVLSFLIKYSSSYCTLHRSDLVARAAPLDPRLYYISYNQFIISFIIDKNLGVTLERAISCKDQEGFIKLFLANQQHIKEQFALLPHLLNCCITNSDWKLLIYLLETCHQHNSINNKALQKVYGKIIQNAVTGSRSEMHAGMALFLSYYPEYLNTVAHTDRHHGTVLQIAANSDREALVEFLLNQPGVDLENMDFDKFSNKAIKKMIKDKK